MIAEKHRTVAWKLLCHRKVLSLPGFSDLESREVGITAAASHFPGTSLHALTVKGSEEKVQSAFVTMASRVLQVQRPSLDGPLTAAGPGRGEK